MNLDQIKKISEAAESALRQFGGYLVDVALRGGKGGSIVEVFVDTDRGITADECALVSRQLAAELELANLVSGRYRIEVSSPGLDRPLKLQRQFTKNIGRHLRVVIRNEGGTLSASGILQDVSEESLTLVTEDERVLSIPREKVMEAFVVPQLK